MPTCSDSQELEPVGAGIPGISLKVFMAITHFLRIHADMPCRIAGHQRKAHVQGTQACMWQRTRSKEREGSPCAIAMSAENGLTLGTQLREGSLLQATGTLRRPGEPLRISFPFPHSMAIHARQRTRRPAPQFMHRGDSIY